jgi:hypothetical protein
MLRTITRRVYHGMNGREYDEYIILYNYDEEEDHVKNISIIHVGTFADEGFPSTVNPNSRRYS